MILLIGATGNVGRPLLRILAGHDDVRVLTRPGGAGKRLAAGFTAVEGNLLEPESLSDAFGGIEHAFILSPPGPRQGEMSLAAIEAAAAAGVGHVVMVSSFAVELDPVPRIVAGHHRAELRLAELGIASTLLRPDFFMTFPFGDPAELARGRLPIPATGFEPALVDPADVAAVAAAELTAAEPRLGPVRISGPEPLSFERIAQEISDAAELTVGYEAADADGFRRRREAGGAAPAAIDAVLELFETLDRHPEAGIVVDTVASVAGRRPRSFHGWLRTPAGASSLTRIASAS